MAGLRLDELYLLAHVAMFSFWRSRYHAVYGLLENRRTTPAARNPAQRLVDRPSECVSEFKLTNGAYLSLIALAVLSFMVALDGTSISVAMPIIAQDLNASAIETFWLGTSFLLSSTVTQPVYTGLSYIFGRKPLLLIALAFFLTGTLVGATAKNITVALVGRSVQGAGGGAINGLVGIILTDLLPLRERPRWFGVIAAMW